MEKIIGKSDTDKVQKRGREKWRGGGNGEKGNEAGGKGDMWGGQDIGTRQGKGGGKRKGWKSEIQRDNQNEEAGEERKVRGIDGNQGKG